MRRRMMASIGGGAKKMPTARDYVQDGLIAMWDGEWNAGDGVHDQNATVWKDLIGQNDLDIVNESSFEKDCLIIPTSNTIGAERDSLLTTRGTIEVVMSASAWENYDICCFLYFGQYHQFGRRNGLVNGCNTDGSGNYGCYTQNLDDGAYGMNSFSITRVRSETGSIAKNNKQLKMTKFSAQGYRPPSIISILSGRGVFRYFNIRIYNRHLSDAEIAANYAIDKARFNLP